jgi:hypothetical protein
MIFVDTGFFFALLSGIREVLAIDEDFTHRFVAIPLVQAGSGVPAAST